MKRHLPSGTEDPPPHPPDLASYPGEWGSRGLLFPSFHRSNINRILKTTRTKIGLPEGVKYRPDAVRRGATQEILQTGNTLEVIKEARGWCVPVSAPMSI